MIPITAGGEGGGLKLIEISGRGKLLKLGGEAWRKHVVNGCDSLLAGSYGFLEMLRAF